MIPTSYKRALWLALLAASACSWEPETSSLGASGTPATRDGEAGALPGGGSSGASGASSAGAAGSVATRIVACAPGQGLSDGGADDGARDCLTGLRYELSRPGGPNVRDVLPLDESFHATYGELNAGTGLTLVASADTADGSTHCAMRAGEPLVFDVVLGETTQVAITLGCAGTYNGPLPIVVEFLGSDRDCSVTAEPASAVVGSSIELSWSTANSASGEVAVSPIDIVGRFVSFPDDESASFECRARGTATLSHTAYAGPCAGIEESVQVECTLPDGFACCPLDPLSLMSGCMQLGGSPPCYTGCQCQREGGIASVEPDANGCLEWLFYHHLDSSYAACLDADGNLNPDPRKACGSFAPKTGGVPPEGSCEAGSLRTFLEVNDAICPSTLGRSCDPLGTWHVTPGDSRDVGCTTLPASLDLRVPGDFDVSANGCELSYVHVEQWANAVDCGALGYAIYLQIDGNTASGSAHLTSTGLCNSDGHVPATAVRVAGN